MLAFLDNLFGRGHRIQDAETTREKSAATISRILAEQAKLRLVSDLELRNKTFHFKQIIQTQLAGIDQKIHALQENIQDYNVGIAEKAEMALQIENLEKQRFKALNEVLNTLLPEAFAVVRETARRWKENGRLVVPMSEYDQAMLQKYYGVRFASATPEAYDEEQPTPEPEVLLPEEAVWPNQWLVTQNLMRWEMEHHEVQLMAGLVLHQGKIAEMDNGEGKTLVATLPAYLNALSGNGVQIATANEYLARRDNDWMGPLFAFLGLSAACIENTRPHSVERNLAYKADITFGTVTEFCFDYLRDCMVTSPDELVQNTPQFLLLDEVDFVLIDEARTPIIISGPFDESSNKVPKERYEEYNTMVIEMVKQQMALVAQTLDEIEPYAENPEYSAEVGLAAAIVNFGAPRNPRVRRLLHRQGVETKMHHLLNTWSQAQAQKFEKIDRFLFFKFEQDRPKITERGIEFINEYMETHFGIPNFANFSDIIAKLDAISLSSITAEKLEVKEQLLDEWAKKEEENKVIENLLRAHTYFENEVHYIVQDEEVKLIDENTGRILPGRRYSDGLHQALEAKEGVPLGELTRTYATITVQNYCRRYPKISGMSATAATDAREFWEIYRLQIDQVPPHQPVIRIRHSDLVYKTKREKFNAIVENIGELHELGRPILIGTSSVEESELLSRLLTLRGVQHQVLNARQHQKEALIIQKAGQVGSVTISTNMAGRGTDIKLSPEALSLGGLAVIGTERHDSRRLDYQLVGRAGRQGNPGSAQFFVSLDDKLMRLFQAERISKLMDTMGHKEGDVIQHSMVDQSIVRAQKKVEENNFLVRSRLFEYDTMLDIQREFIYKKRMNFLKGHRLQYDIMNIYYEMAEQIIESSNSADLLVAQCMYYLGIDIPEDFYKKDRKTLTNEIFWLAYDRYHRKNQSMAQRLLPIIRDVYEREGHRYKRIVLPFAAPAGLPSLSISANMEAVLQKGGLAIGEDMTRMIYLAFLDDAWKTHLVSIDDLKEQVNEVQQGKSVDPIIAYKTNAFYMYRELLGRINQQVVRFLSHGELQLQDQNQAPTNEEEEEESFDTSNIVLTGEDDEPEEAYSDIDDEQILNASERCFKVSGRDITGELAWYFILVDEDKVDAFRAREAGDSYNLEDYGRIIISGYGEEVPEDVKAMLEERYGFDNF